MTNPYYAHTDVVYHSRGRSQIINDQLTAVEAGFALLPTPTALREDRDTYAADSGVANAYVATLSALIVAYTEGLHVRLKIGASNTAASTLNVNALGVKSILRADGTALQVGDLAAGMIVDLTYNGAVFLMAGANASLIPSTITTYTALWAGVGGAADAYTGAFSPAVGSLIDGLVLGFRATAANATTTPTFKADATTARTITRFGGAALLSGDLQTNGEYLIRYNLANTRWELFNPRHAIQKVSSADAPSFAGATLTAALTYGGVTLSNSVLGTGSMLLGADGTFTPTDQSGAGLVLTVLRAAFSRVGTRHLVDLTLNFPATGDGTQAKIGLGALPVFANVLGVGGAWTVYDGLVAIGVAIPLQNTNTFVMSTPAGGAITNANLTGAAIRMQFQLSPV